MFKRLVNLPFKVVGRAARVVQRRQDTVMKDMHGDGQDGDDWTQGGGGKFDTPDDYEPGHIAIDVAELRDDIDADREMGIVDLREPDERGVGHIPGSESMPMSLLAIRLAELPPAGVRVVVYCNDGEQSREGARFLRFRGLDDAVWLEGGIDAWLAAGGAVQKSSQ